MKAALSQLSMRCPELTLRMLAGAGMYPVAVFIATPSLGVLCGLGKMPEGPES